MPRSRAPTAWPRPSSSAPTSSATDSVALVLGDNIFYGTGLGTALAAEDDGLGRAHLRLPRHRALGLRRRRVRRRRHGAVHRGEARAPQVLVCRAGPVLLRQRRGADRPRPAPQPPGRAGDHRGQRRLPPAGRPHRDRAPARDGLARHRDVQGAHGRVAVRVRGRGPAGSEDRLHRGDRLAQRLAGRRGVRRTRRVAAQERLRRLPPGACSTRPGPASGDPTRSPSPTPSRSRRASSRTTGACSSSPSAATCSRR